MFVRVLWLSRAKWVCIWTFFTIIDYLLGHFLGSILFYYCRLFCGHSFTISKLLHYYTVRVDVLIDVDVPIPPVIPLIPLKKSSLSNIDPEEKPLNPPNPPKLPNPPLLELGLPSFPLRRLKKLLKKSSSSWSKPLFEKKFAKISSASLKLKWE